MHTVVVVVVVVVVRTLVCTLLSLAVNLGYLGDLTLRIFLGHCSWWQNTHNAHTHTYIPFFQCFRAN